jgi:hypothetical protein
VRDRAVKHGACLLVDRRKPVPPLLLSGERERKKKAKIPYALKTRLAQIKNPCVYQKPSTAKDNKEKMRVGAASRVDLGSLDGE